MARTRLGMSLRPMRAADTGEVAALEREIFAQPWSQGVFDEELAQIGRHYVVVEDDDGRVFGYGGMMVVGDDAHVVTLAVLPHRRGKGVGARLLLELIDRARGDGARHLTLEVRRSNLPAQELYRRFGFAPVGVRKNYYRDEDALVMWAIDIDTPEYATRLDEMREGLQ